MARKNEKQKLIKLKGIENLKGFIAEIEKAIKILDAQDESLNVSKNEHQKKICPKCKGAGMIIEDFAHDAPCCDLCNGLGQID